MKNTQQPVNHPHLHQSLLVGSLEDGNNGNGILDSGDSTCHTMAGQQKERRARGASTVGSAGQSNQQNPLPRLNANSRLSTALPASLSSSSVPSVQQQHQLHGEGLRIQSDWTAYASSTHPLHYQNQQVVGGGYENPSDASTSFSSSAGLNQMTAAAATANVAKFEPGTQMSSTASSTSSNGFASANWSSMSMMGTSMATDWELAAAAIGRGHAGLESRMMSTPPYYNAANYVNNPVNYLYGSQHCYNLQRASNVGAAPFQTLPTYLATTNNAAAAAVGSGLNYGTTGYGGCGTSFSDYYGLNNYYTHTTNTSGSMLNSSSAIHDFASNRSNSSSSNYCNAAQPNGHYSKAANANRTSTNAMSSNSSEISGMSGQQQQLASTSSSQQHQQLSPSSSTMVLKTEKTKRPKKRKLAGNGGGSGVGSTVGGLATSAAEPNNTRVFIWELEDLCLLACHPYRTVDTFMLQVIDQMLSCAFHLEHMEECDQANIDDAEVDESMHELPPTCVNPLLSSPITTAIPLVGVNGCSTDGKSISTPYHSDGGGGSSIGSGGSPDHQTTSNGSEMNFLETGQITNDPQLMALSTSSTNGSAVNRGMLEGLRRIASKYQHIKSTYERFKGNLSDLLDYCGLTIQKADIMERFHNYDKISGCQTERYRRCLRIIKDRSNLIKDRCTNVVLTSEGLPISLAKLMAFDFANFIRPENVYSTSKIGKEQALARITERYKKRHAVVVSSNNELGVLSKKENIPFWKINNLADVDALYFALDTILLVDASQPMSNLQQPYLNVGKC